MKRKMGVSGIPALVFVLGLAVCEKAGAQEAAPPHTWAGVVLHGETEPLLEGTRWRAVVERISIGDVVFVYEFRAGGELVRRRWPWNGYELLYRNTWEREGDRIRIISEDGKYHYEGKYDPTAQRITLTVEASSGWTEEMEWEPHSEPAPPDFEPVGSSHLSRKPQVCGRIPARIATPIQ